MPADDYGRLKLLFVDDDPLTRLMLREILRNTSWRNADIVDGAALALRHIKARPPDLVFTDLQMPGMSGIDLIRDIRALPDSADPLLPIILLTASGNAEHVRSGRRAGASGFLVKPISLARITERLIDAVTRQRPFVVAPGYIGPEWRRGAPPLAGVQRRSELSAGNVVLPPDGLLLARIRGDAAAIRDAQQRRAEAIAAVWRTAARHRAESGADRQVG